MRRTCDTAGMRVRTFDAGGLRLVVVSRPYSVTGVLTPAERDVAVMIAAGRSDREIAHARGTAVRTVAKQVRSILAKLEVASRRCVAGALLTRS